MKKKFMTTEELAERWSMSPGTLKNWRSLGKGPSFIKHGKSKQGKDLVRYLVSDIEDYENKIRQNVSA